MIKKKVIVSIVMSVAVATALPATNTYAYAPTNSYQTICDLSNGSVLAVVGIGFIARQKKLEDRVNKAAEHTKNKRKSTHDKHTKKRAGGPEKKKVKSKGWKSRK